MKWLRSADGLVCFGFAVFFAVATLQDFFLPSVVVTDVVFADYNGIIANSVAVPRVVADVCVGNAADEPSVASTCACLTQAGTDKITATKCMLTHRSLPAEQRMVGHLNPNFILFYIFLVSSMFQLVMRNSLELDMTKFSRDVQIGVSFMIAGTCIALVMSLFNFSHGIDPFMILNFMPHQVVLLLAAFMMYNNAHFPNIDRDIRDKYKRAIFSGVYNISMMPFMALFVCCINSWTTVAMLHFVYTTVILITLIQLAHQCVYIDKKNGSENPAAKVRMYQAVYLLLITLLVSLTIVILMYFPQHTSVTNRVLGICSIILLWALHLLFDCTRSSLDSYMYERSFNIYDACLAVLRYALLMFSLYFVWGAA
jgi:hypothetical protein